MIHQKCLHNKQHKVLLLWRIYASVIWGRSLEHLLKTMRNGSTTGKYLQQGSGLYGNILGLNRHLDKIPVQAPWGPWGCVIHNVLEHILHQRNHIRASGLGMACKGHSCHPWVSVFPEWRLRNVSQAPRHSPRSWQKVDFNNEIT